MVKRQRALRKLWTTNPALAVLDGLNDYDLDYTDAAMNAGKVASSYIPGRGYAKLEEIVEKVAEITDDDGAEEDDLPEFDTAEVQAEDKPADPASEPASPDLGEDDAAQDSKQDST